MNATPKTMAQQVRKAEEVRNSVTKDVRRLAYTSTTGDAPRVCREHTMHDILADLPGDRTVGYCYCGEYMDTGTWDERRG